MSIEDADVVIVGAGPYGLSLASQLRKRRVSYRIIGQPMKFWRDMPIGVNLEIARIWHEHICPRAGSYIS